MLWRKPSPVINCAENLFIRKAKRVVRSVKNANKITAAGLEGYPASGKGRLNDVTDSSTASSFPVSAGPPRPIFPKWAPGSLPSMVWVSQGSIQSWDLLWCTTGGFPHDLGVLRCRGSSFYLNYSPCWISYPWNGDLAGHWASNASAVGSEGRCNPGAAVGAFGVQDPRLRAAGLLAVMADVCKRNPGRRPTQSMHQRK